MRDVEILKNKGIDIEKSLEILGDMEMYDETMNDFLMEMEDRMPKLEEYKNNDMENYAILVHAIKSDSKYLGFTNLAELAFQHEMKSKENDINYVAEHYQELRNEINRIIDIAHNYLGE